jgi:alpha-beta hydrolase superfamily lysophospholipase
MSRIEHELKTTDGLRLRAQAWLPEGAPRAVLVLNHGQGDWSDRYAHVGAALNQGGYAVYTYDLRGHGQSQGQRGHTPSHAHLLDDLQLALDWAGGANPGRKLFLFGHSMGGQITLNYALRRRSAAVGAVVTSPWLRLALKTPAWVDGLGRALQAVAPTFSQSNQIRSGEVDMRSHDLALLNAIHDPAQEHGLISVREFFASREAGEYALAHAPDFRLPLLLLCGGDDPIASTPASQEFFDRCGAADKTYKSYPGMFHEVLNEVDRATVFADIRAWLDQRA